MATRKYPEMAHFFDLFDSMVLTRKEKEDMVIELHRQGKGTRDIAREVRMSFGPIIRKETQGREIWQERVVVKGRRYGRATCH